MDVKIDDAAMKELVAKAVFDKITPEQRDELLQSAIVTLITERKRYPHDTKKSTPLGELFERAVQSIADELIKEDLKQDAKFKEQLVKLYHDAWDRIFDTDSEVREKIIDRLSVVFSEVLLKLGRSY